MKEFLLPLNLILFAIEKWRRKVCLVYCRLQQSCYYLNLMELWSRGRRHCGNEGRAPFSPLPIPFTFHPTNIQLLLQIEIVMILFTK